MGRKLTFTIFALVLVSQFCLVFGARQWPPRKRSRNSSSVFWHTEPAPLQRAAAA